MVYTIIIVINNVLFMKRLFEKRLDFAQKELIFLRDEVKFNRFLPGGVIRH